MQAVNGRDEDVFNGEYVPIKKFGADRSFKEIPDFVQNGESDLN